MIKYYSRSFWKSNARNFKENKPYLVYAIEYIATDDVSKFNYKKKYKFVETNSAKEFFKNNPDFKINKVYQVEQRNDKI